MTTGNDAFIICDSLVKIFKVADTEVLALQGLDLTVRRGELVGVVGSSGSGKTTLMNVLGGLTRPSAGQVRVDEYDLLKMSGRELNHYRQVQVGFVWQQSSRNLIPYRSALDNIRLHMTLAGRAGLAANQRAHMLLDLVGLGDRHNHKPVEMSGGEQQRVSIAVALANEPSLLLADEPTGEIDSATADQVYELFRRLNRELGLTIIIVSHDPLLAQHVNRVVAIRDGKLASETVRRQTKQADLEQMATDHFEELTVLDSAGRLQIPQVFREQLAIQSRVYLEVADGGLVIRPAQNLDATSSQSEITIEQKIEHDEDHNGLFSRFRRRKK